jgi:hypothetical protein
MYECTMCQMGGMKPCDWSTFPRTTALVPDPGTYRCSVPCWILEATEPLQLIFFLWWPMVWLAQVRVLGYRTCIAKSRKALGHPGWAGDCHSYIFFLSIDCSRITFSQSPNSAFVCYWRRREATGKNMVRREDAWNIIGRKTRTSAWSCLWLV